MTRTMRLSLAVSTALLAAGIAAGASAQQQSPMTFFITSVGKGNGADLGGLDGADGHCAALAKAAGSTLATGAPISAPRSPAATRESMPATASAKARGTAPRAC